jgi:hypothetical protein
MPQPPEAKGLAEDRIGNLLVDRHARCVADFFKGQSSDGFRE